MEFKGGDSFICSDSQNMGRNLVDGFSGVQLGMRCNKKIIGDNERVKL